jgi:hypothetical protein
MLEFDGAAGQFHTNQHLESLSTFDWLGWMALLLNFIACMLRDDDYDYGLRHYSMESRQHVQYCQTTVKYASFSPRNRHVSAIFASFKYGRYLALL